RFRIPAVHLVEIDKVGAEPLQAAVDRRHYMLARGAPVVRPGSGRAEELGRDDERIPVSMLADETAEHALARAVAIGIGGIEEIDPAFDRPPEEGEALLFIERPVRVHPALAVAHAAQAEPG